MTVLDLLPKTSPKIQCTFLEVQCQLMYCLLTVSRLQREILPHCAIKLIACDKRTFFLDIIHTCLVQVVRVITKTPKHLFGFLKEFSSLNHLISQGDHETTCVCNNSSELSRKQLRVDLVTVSSQDPLVLPLSGNVMHFQVVKKNF